MKIAIVGGGFFGCYVARFLSSRLDGKVEVDIYDRSQSLMTKAAMNNQARLHLGFHYPRSPETIQQTVVGFRYFVEEFGRHVSFPESNLYAIHRNGYLTFEKYLEAIDVWGLNYEICGKDEYKYFKDERAIEGIIRVREGVINLSTLRLDLIGSLDARFIGRSDVTDIDSQTGDLVVNGKRRGRYDFVVNTTYTNPNLGLPEPRHFKLKYELTCMVLLANPFGSDVALTIMDGPFVSLYPWRNKLATLSSVLYTPYVVTESLEDLERHRRSSDRGQELSKAASMILEHSKALLRISETEILVKRILKAPKCKLRYDHGDTRVSILRSAGRLVAVLPGKVDSCRLVATTVLRHILGETEVGVSAGEVPD